jgi:PAS domain S-box-containing protein
MQDPAEIIQQQREEIVALRQELEQRSAAALGSKAEATALWQQLATERSFLEAVLQQMPAGVIIAEAPTGKLILGNQQVEQIWRQPFRPSTDIDQYQAYQGFHEDGTPYAPEEWPLARAILTGEAVEGEEIQFRRGDDTWGTMEVYATPVLNAQGEIIAGVVTFRDVTERKQAEADLRESQKLFVSFMGNTPTTAFIKDEQGHYVYVNPQIEERFCCSAADWIGKTDFDLFPPEVAQPWREHDRQVLATGQAIAVPETVEHNGSRSDYLSIKFPIEAASGKRMVGGMSVDVTERRQLEEALRQEKERFELAAAAVNCLIYDWDLRTHRVERTEGLTRLFGYSLQEAEPTQNWWTARIHPEDLPAVQEQLLAMLARQDHYTAEYRFQTKNGGYRYVLDQGTVLRGSEGRPLRAVGSTTDITERKQAEQEREQLLVREQVARQEAETANRIKDEFLAVLSHELRTPLNPILGWVQLLQSRKLDAVKTAQALETIERNARLQTQLIEDLLDVSRILQGKLRLQVEPVDLVAVTEAAIATVRLAAEAKSIKLHTQFGVLLTQVAGDATRLQQVVWNLLSNAVKFTALEGSIQVQLTQQDTYVYLQVKDTGKGIAPAFLPHVFEYFRQADGTTTRSVGGLGLGLAISRHLVELHGGTIQADSGGEGQGATFTVALPLLPEPTPITEPTPSAPNRPRLDGLWVLVVDDNADTRALLSFLLEQYGARVTTAAAASEALAALGASGPDILVSDIGMPEEDGYELIRQVRSRTRNQGGSVPAIALTAYVSNLDQQRALSAGYQCHLAKPVESEVLVGAIYNLVQGSELKR